MGNHFIKWCHIFQCKICATAAIELWIFWWCRTLLKYQALHRGLFSPKDFYFTVWNDETFQNFHPVLNCFRGSLFLRKPAYSNFPFHHPISFACSTYITHQPSIKEIDNCLCKCWKWLLQNIQTKLRLAQVTNATGRYNYNCWYPM